MEVADISYGLQKYNITHSCDNLLLDEAEEYRKALIDSVNKKSDEMYRSPIYGKYILSSGGSPIVYSYERSLDCSILENKAASLRESNDTWDVQHIIYSSGMASITSTIQNFIHMMLHNKDKIKIAVFGAYYETRMVLDYISYNNLEWTYCCNVEDIVESIKNDVDIILLEPVRYDWDLDVLDIPTIVHSLDRYWRNNNSAKLVIFDSTLIAEELPLNSIMERLKYVPNMILANINSLLKLHQQGLELTNAGIVSLYVSKNNSKSIPVEDIGKFFRKIRTITDKSLKLREVLLLDNPFSFCRDEVKKYSGQVFFNNALLALSLDNQGIFKRVSHPINDCNKYSWAKSPFVVLELREGSLANYQKLIDVIEFEARSNNLPLYYGSSFGFRHCRYEIIIPNLKDQIPIFKVAMGFITGDNRNQIITLLTELSKFKSFYELAKNYENSPLGNIRLDDLE